MKCTKYFDAVAQPGVSHWAQWYPGPREPLNNFALPVLC